MTRTTSGGGVGHTFSLWQCSQNLPPPCSGCRALRRIHPVGPRVGYLTQHPHLTVK